MSLLTSYISRSKCSRNNLGMPCGSVSPNMRHGKLNVASFASIETSNFTRKSQRKSSYISTTSDPNLLTVLPRCQLGKYKTIEFVVITSLDTTFIFDIEMTGTRHMCRTLSKVCEAHLTESPPIYGNCATPTLSSTKTRLRLVA